MAGDVPVTPEMIAAGWAIVNDGRKWPPRIGSGPGLVEVYRAMRALEPATTHQRTVEALREAEKARDDAITARNEAGREWRRVFDKMHQRAMAAEAALAKIKEAT